MEPMVLLKDGTQIPALGQGTWFMGENFARKKEEKAALLRGIELGMTLIDTAEMYGSGASEKLVGEVVKEAGRDSVFLVSKVYPHHAGRKHIFSACEASLKRMGIETLDLYLLHWRGSVPLRETVSCMEELVAQGKIRRWGVSNLDTYDMQELLSIKDGGHCAVNQVLYHLGSRGIEYELLPYLNQHQIPIMAYCPLAQGGSLRRELLRSRAVLEVAKRHSATPVQILLSFVLQQKNVIAIPKSANAKHTQENAAARNILLSEQDKDLLNTAFPAPNYRTPLDIV